MHPLTNKQIRQLRDVIATNKDRLQGTPAGGYAQALELAIEECTRRIQLELQVRRQSQQRGVGRADRPALARFPSSRPPAGA